MKVCGNCHKINNSAYKLYCKNCYYGLKSNPKAYIKRTYKDSLLNTLCDNCKKLRLTKEDINKSLCRYCYISKRKTDKPEIHEKHKKLCRDYRRKQKGIDCDLPLLIAPAGSGSIKKGQGYRTICKKEFRGMPHADKKGRIAEHTYVMMQHLERPLKKGENVHHINGIRDDNRIENLELWHRSQPPGQRVEEKIKWCIEFLNGYDYDVKKR